MKTALGALLLALMLGTACSDGDENANSAGPLCKLTGSPNMCLRCQAQKCASQLDYCFGAGFHSGELIAANASNGTAACFDFSRCVQACGCFDNCFNTCNDQIHSGCAECQQKVFATCRNQLCAVECGAVDGGA